MTRQLDVSTLPFARQYHCKDGSVIDLADALDRARPACDTLLGVKLVEGNESGSFGFVMAPPVLVGAEHTVRTAWDDPSKTVWFAGGWGGKRDRYICNAIGKLRALLREGGDSTANLRENQLMGQECFRDIIAWDRPDNDLPLGDFPWSGGVRLRLGRLILAGAVSGWHEIDDHAIACLLLGLIGKQILLGDSLLPELEQ